MRHALALLAGLAVWLILTLAPARADERILSFDALIEVAESGDFTVTETIRVYAEGDQIRQGILRDFPLLQRNGLRYQRVGFELLSAQLDGAPVPSRIEQDERVLRIYLGQPGRMLDPGEHTFQISYRTDRQMRYFDDHDEVYWNAIGTEWPFPIDHATARVRLPPDAQVQDLAAFTGPHGATDQNARMTAQPDGSLLFETTRPLGPREGMTIAVAIAKGAVAPPSEAMRHEWFMRDQGERILSFDALIEVAESGDF
ncbi:MAG: DUF2207 domain-containing protein, partial [Paracoccus sp. (in: a-proteobacteria)]|nr:DUF2207 domain-containing protein [Paracoccus sp. (in: a-proteobacteria)]